VLATEYIIQKIESTPVKAACFMLEIAMVKLIQSGQVF
jgi:hypothetical protein